jgi:hypothetical protein
MVGSGDHDSVHVFAIEELSEIVEFGRRLSLGFGDDLGGAIKVSGIDVADSDCGDIGMLEELVEAGSALAAETDETHPEAVARGRRGKASGGHMDKRSSGEFGHHGSG